MKTFFEIATYTLMYSTFCWALIMISAWVLNYGFERYAIFKKRSWENFIDALSETTKYRAKCEELEEELRIRKDELVKFTHWKDTQGYIRTGNNNGVDLFTRDSAEIRVGEIIPQVTFDELYQLWKYQIRSENEF